MQPNFFLQLNSDWPFGLAWSFMWCDFDVECSKYDGTSDQMNQTLVQKKASKFCQVFAPSRSDCTYWDFILISNFLEKKILLLVRFPPIQIKSLLIHRGMPIPFQFFGHFYRWLNFRKFFAVAQISKSYKSLSWASSLLVDQVLFFFYLTKANKFWD